MKLLLKISLLLLVSGNLYSGETNCLKGASAAAFDRGEEIEVFGDCGFFPTTLCLGDDGEIEHSSSWNDYFVVSECSGLIIDDKIDPSVLDAFGMIASISFDEDNWSNGEPKELVAERHTIKGCKGRAFRSQRGE